MSQYGSLPANSTVPIVPPGYPQYPGAYPTADYSTLHYNSFYPPTTTVGKEQAAQHQHHFMDASVLETLNCSLNSVIQPLPINNCYQYTQAYTNPVFGDDHSLSLITSGHASFNIGTSSTSDASQHLSQKLFAADHATQPLTHLHHDTAALQQPATSHSVITTAQQLQQYNYGDTKPTLTNLNIYTEQMPSTSRVTGAGAQEQVLDVSSTTSSPRRCGGDESNRNNPSTSNSGTGGAKRGRPTKNPCWSYFSRLDDDRVVKCNLCGKLVKSACATNMTKHLERHHGADDAVPYNSRKMEPQWFGVDGTGQTYSGDSSNATLWNQNVVVPWNAAERRNAKRNRRTKHPVWELFRRTGEGSASCDLCGALVRSPCSSNFMGHLNRHHIDHYHVIYSRWMQGRMDEIGIS